jgi:hypothetical protein
VLEGIAVLANRRLDARPREVVEAFWRVIGASAVVMGRRPATLAAKPG